MTSSATISADDVKANKLLEGETVEVSGTIKLQPDGSGVVENATVARENSEEDTAESEPGEGMEVGDGATSDEAPTTATGSAGMKAMHKNPAIAILIHGGKPR